MRTMTSRFLISLFCVMSVYSKNLLGDSYSMPWEGPLERIMYSLTGPVAKVAGILSIAGAGLALAMNQSEGFSRTAIRIVFGLSIAFAAGTWGLALFGFGGR